MSMPDVFSIMRSRAERKHMGGVSPSSMPTPRREDAIRAEPVSTVPAPTPPHVETTVLKPAQKEISLVKPLVHGSSSQPQPQTSKRGRSEESRHGKEPSRKKKRSGSISAHGEFVLKFFDEYRADPMEAAIQVFRHFTDLVQKTKGEMEARVQAAEKEKDLAVAQLEGARTQTKKDADTISNLQKELSQVKQERNEIDNSRMLASQRVIELGFALKISEEAKSKSEGKLSGLEDKIADPEEKLRRS